MINPKEKAELQGMWGQAHSASTDLPDGTYQFQIVNARFHMSDKGRPQFKTKVKVTGGAEEYVGKELEINDNLETPDNMGWFKKKLTRLNIALPDDFDEVCDGTLAEQMIGKVFEGQAKTKNDFLNVYVNRLIGERSVEEAPESEAESEPEAPQGEDQAYAEGDAVEYKGKAGTVIEVCGGGLYRIKLADGKIYRLEEAKLDRVAEPEAEPESGAIKLPTPDEVESMAATEVKQVLKDLGLDAAKVKTPRVVLHGFATLAEDPTGKIELTEIAPLADALGVVIKKGTPLKNAVKALSKAVQSRLG